MTLLRFYYWLLKLICFTSIQAISLIVRQPILVGYDNFSTGQWRFLEGTPKDPALKLVEGDLFGSPVRDKIPSTGGDSWFFHFAGNADIRFGTEHLRQNLEQNTITTYNVLEAK